MTAIDLPPVEVPAETSPWVFDADGHVPGPDFPGAPPAGFRFTATFSSVSLRGMFNARGGPSVIQIPAPGNVTLEGDYRVAPSGCSRRFPSASIVDFRRRGVRSSPSLAIVR